MVQWTNRDTVETVGVFAVVISLIFVGMELAQNTSAVRAQTVQEIHQDIRDQLRFSKDEAMVSAKPHSDRTPAEKIMRQQYFIRAMRSYENQWYHYTEGYLDEQFYLAYQQHLRYTLGLENFLERWDFYKELGFFHPEFVTFVDEYIANNPPYLSTEFTVQH